MTSKNIKFKYFNEKELSFYDFYRRNKKRFVKRYIKKSRFC